MRGAINMAVGGSRAYFFGGEDAIVDCEAWNLNGSLKKRNCNPPQKTRARHSPTLTPLNEARPALLPTAAACSPLSVNKRRAHTFARAFFRLVFFSLSSIS